MLASMRLEGTLSSDILQLSELQILDLSYNKGLSGPLPSAIGTLSKLTNLILVGCNFNGPLPDSIGALSQLRFLYMNSNSFTGSIPNSFGNLSKLFWLDLGENKLTGTIPVSNGTTPGLDMLVNAKHFHLGRNQLSGSIPPQLLHENMTMLHLLLDNNQLTGSIPTTLGSVNTLEVVRLDWNSINGSIPSNFSNLGNVTDVLLSNNQLTGPLPNFTAMDHLNYLDMSNNSFDPSDFPSWFIMLPLTDLIMENTQLQGHVPDALFNLPNIQQVILKNNRLNGTLDIGETHSSGLRIINLQNNRISAYTHRPGDSELQLNLTGNLVCGDDTIGVQNYCGGLQQSIPSYSTPHNCFPGSCTLNKISSPNCQCAYPYTGNFVFRAPHFSNLQNSTYFTLLEIKLMTTFLSYKLPVDSVSLSNVSRTASNYFGITLQIFPLAQERFNRTAISILGFMLSNQTFKPPPVFGTFYFTANEYTTFADDPAYEQKKTLSMSAIIGLVVGGFVFLLILLCVGVYIFYRRKRPAKPVEPTYSTGLIPASPWASPGSDISALQMPGSRVFTLEEVKKITANFSEANEIGAGAFGKVYKGVLANGLLVAVKRANQESRHGGLQFKTEIELLTRVHHKNLVKLLGFCLERGELILIYEYVPNGSLKESLSGKSGIRLDWKRRIQVALDAARGLAYLHELASPAIVHRDIKSNNILLDENLNAKVSDFGLSKPLSDAGKDYITTEVKGTMGYMDPEYYMTHKLNEKSDVYSFGVLMLELVTGRSALVRGKFIVREVKMAIDRTQDLYGLHEVLDPGIGLGTSLKGIEKYVDLALRCVEESGVNRPAMGEVVKQLEDLLEMAGLNPYSDSGGSSAAFDLYAVESFYLRNGALPR